MSYEFNWKNYLHSNPDLLKSNICSKKKAWRHFITKGILEKRNGVEFKKYLSKDYIEDNFVIIFTHYNPGNLEKYWIHNYECIRKIYPNIKIVIINDNSKVRFNKNFIINNTINTELVESEYPGSGELLSYYYFLKYKYNKNAIIIHDSVFIVEPLDIEDNIKFQPFWYFESFHWYNKLKPIVNKILSTLNFSKELIEINNSRNYIGCFGVMSIINHEYLSYLNCKYSLFPDLLRLVNNRNLRMAFERVLPIIIKHDQYQFESMFLSIHNYTYSITLGKKKFGLKFDEYIQNKPQLEENSEIVKVWSGR